MLKCSFPRYVIVNFEHVCLKMLCSFGLVKVHEGLYKATKSWKALNHSIKHLNSTITQA